MRDTKCEVLWDALTTAAKPNILSKKDEIYFNYVLCPRINGEFLQPFHTEIHEALSPYINTREINDEDDARALVNEIITWARDSIAIADSLNTRKLQATPAGTLRIRMADGRSKDIFTVAALRTFGIPARVDQMTGKDQYMIDNEWVDITAESAALGTISEKGTMTMNYVPGKGTLDNPEYYRHFTLSRIQDGQRRLLDFEDGDATELGADASAKRFSTPFTLDAGTYLLTSGTRLASGKVLARMTTFRVEKGKNTDVQLVMRDSKEEISVIGAMDPEALYTPVEGDGSTAAKKSILSTTGRGYFLVMVFSDGDEPSNHAIRDVQSMLPELGQWGRPVMVFGQSGTNVDKLAKTLDGSDIHFGIDTGSEIRDMLCNGCHSESKTLPVIAMCDSFGRIVYVSTGYNTSLASQLRTVIAGI